MVVLKKVRGSTLMETLISSVLIVVIFMVASLIMNNMFSNSIRNDTRAITAHLNELEYLSISDKLKVPYMDEYDGWDISIKKGKNGRYDEVQFLAHNQITNKTIIRSSYCK
nr:hypothetical protein [uncultured Psychroserpens sp.]